MKVEYLGKQADTAELARLIGMSHATLISRIHAGWSVEDAVSKPLNPSHVRGPEKRTKHMAGLWLDELPIDRLPSCFSDVIRGYTVGRISTYLRNHQSQTFNQWYLNDFLRMKLDFEKESSTESS